MSRDDYNYGITENAIWLDIDDGTCSWNSDDLNKMKGNYVIVEGVFNSDEKGHFDMYSGTVEKIKRIELKKSIDELNKIKNMVQNN